MTDIIDSLFPPGEPDYLLEVEHDEDEAEGCECIECDPIIYRLAAAYIARDGKMPPRRVRKADPERRTFTIQLYDRSEPDPEPKPFQGPLRPPMFNGKPISQEAHDILSKAFSGMARGSDD